MRPSFRALVLGLVIVVSGVTADARAQAPAPAPIEGNIYAVTYVEVMPTAKADAATLLKRYREAARKEGGNLRCEVAQRIDQPHQFAILEIWKDQAAFEAHGKGANTTDTREKITAIRNAPTDERVHVGLSVGPIDAPTVRGAIYVATHVRAKRTGSPRSSGWATRAGGLTATCASRSSSRSTVRTISR